MEAIAAQRTLQLGTVQSYIAEAMAAGFSYPWHRMGVPHRILASLCGHVTAYHKLQLQQQERLQQASEQQSQNETEDQQQQELCSKGQQCLLLKQQQRGNSGVAQSQASCSQCGLLQSQSSVSLHTDGLVRSAQEEVVDLSTTEGQQGRCTRLPDSSLLTELVLTGKGRKALRDSMDSSLLTYGHMRLALAHIYCLLRNSVCLCRLPGQTELKDRS